jgi:hypothetical protein
MYGLDPIPKTAPIKPEPNLPEQMDSKPLGEDKVQDVELLDPSDDEQAPQGLAPLNLSAEAEADLVEFDNLQWEPCLILFSQSLSTKTSDCLPRWNLKKSLS